jgi:hypothetical protein
MVESDIDERRHDHAAQRANCGESRLLDGRQFAFDQFTLDFEAHVKKEYGHQAVVNPVEQVFVDAERADADRDRRIQESAVCSSQRRVGQQERQHRRK